MSQERVAAISITLPMSQVVELQKRADEEGRPVSHVIREAVAFFLSSLTSNGSQILELQEVPS